MGLLDFTKPIKCSAKQARTNPDLFDAAKADSLKWKAQMVTTGGGYRHIEIRRTFDGGPNYAHMLIIVGMDGWDISDFEKRTPDRWGRDTRGFNVRISCNSPAVMTFEQFEEINAVIEEAKAILS